MKNNTPSDDLDLFALAKAKKEKQEKKDRREKLNDRLLSVLFSVIGGVLTALVIHWLGL